MSGPVTRRAALVGAAALAVAATGVGEPPTLRTLHVGDLVTEPREVELLRHVRGMTPGVRAAFLRMMEDMAGGMPTADAMVRFHVECGWEEPAARELVADALAGLGRAVG